MTRTDHHVLRLVSFNVGVGFERTAAASTSGGVGPSNRRSAWAKDTTRTRCREALRNVRLHLSVALHVTLYVILVAVKRCEAQCRPHARSGVGPELLRENRRKIAGVLVVKHDLQDQLQSDRLVTASGHTQSNSAIQRRGAEMRGSATPRRALKQRRQHKQGHYSEPARKSVRAEPAVRGKSRSVCHRTCRLSLLVERPHASARSARVGNQNATGDAKPVVLHITPRTAARPTTTASKQRCRA